VDHNFKNPILPGGDYTFGRVFSRGLLSEIYQVISK
jgi:hypothetical protein